MKPDAPAAPSAAVLDSVPGEPFAEGPAEDAGPPPLVGEELRLLEVVLTAARRMTGPRLAGDYDAELIKLRDLLADEHLAEDQASLLEQMERVSSIAAQRAKSNFSALDLDSPYFGHLRLEDESGRRDVLIGKQTCVSGAVKVVDWRNAPISKIFYQYREGDEYAMEIANREQEGRVLVRRSVTIARGELMRVATPERTFVRHGAEWADLSSQGPSLKGGAGSAARPDRTRPVLGLHGGGAGRGAARVDKHLPEIASLLDPQQFGLITHPDSGVVAIQGSAGSGKTTVALHRVAYLVYQDARRFSPKRSLIVVLSPALASYISQVLPALGVEGVPVMTYEAWASETRKRHFPNLPHRYAEDTPAVVARLKRHTALVRLFDEAARKTDQHGTRSPVGMFEELFTSKGWLAEGFAKHAPGEFRPGELEVVHDWCSRQHYIRSEGSGHNEDDFPTLDAEDDTILLRLHQLLRGPLRDRHNENMRISQLVVDEAQDFSPLELRVMLDAVPRGQPVTLAGDVAQQVMDGSDFGDWDKTLGALGLEHVKVSPLRVSYRSTRPIMELARAVLGPLAPVEELHAPRDGVPVELFRFGGRGEAYAFLSDALRDLALGEPSASVALLAYSPSQASEAYNALARADLPTLRRVADHDFSFSPGIEVTDVRQAKGLEFDYVIMLDVDAVTYPVTDASRRLLHVGITRAAHQCWLMCVGTPTQLLPDWLVAEQR